MLSDIELTEKKRTTLVLTQTDPERDVMFHAWLNNGMNADILLWNCPKIVRGIRRLWLDGRLPGVSFWYGKWKVNLQNYDTVIIHADIRSRTVPKWIRKQFPQIRIVYWYWNPVNKKSDPKLTKIKDLELWSFDEADCKKYQMKKNIQYYYKTDVALKEPWIYDIYFAGHDKGRKVFIEKLVKDFEHCGLKSCIQIVEEGKWIPYSVIQSNISRSRAVLDVSQSGQSGYTLRVLEALFFEKKLITTNKSIMSEEFYRKENVYIVGMDSDIKEFMEIPMIDVSVYRKKFEIDSWFSNFFEDT